ncbi:MAG TPA: hypothetical protein VN851_01915 [Thermoanaerobaculia bacterium]|nr:hypothetical protein [Thermoanaerobaculia bacterium]
MPVHRPYRRTCRQFVDGSYTEGGRWEYMLHPKFAQSPEHYVRAFILLLKDVQELFDYIEPADVNLTCYSYRVHALLLRACVEVEANCKAILKENSYRKSGALNMEDYRKIDKTHLLSSYKVKVPNWSGNQGIREPFLGWATSSPLLWYQAYNATKHDRYSEFEQANFGHLIDACCGVLVVLSSQFETNDFAPGDWLLSAGGPNDGMRSGIGGYFRVQFPESWPVDLRYDFKWETLKDDPDPFQEIDYLSLCV